MLGKYRGFYTLGAQNDQVKEVINILGIWNGLKSEHLLPLQGSKEIILEHTILTKCEAKRRNMRNMSKNMCKKCEN